MGLISPGSGVRAPPGARSYSVMVITKDSDSFNPGSSPGRTFCLCPPLGFLFLARVAKAYVLVAQLDKASDYESEDWGFKSLQGYVFIFLQSGTTRSVLHILSGVDSRRYSSVGRASD